MYTTFGSFPLITDEDEDDLEAWDDMPKAETYEDHLRLVDARENAREHKKQNEFPARLRRQREERIALARERSAAQPANILAPNSLITLNVGDEIDEGSNNEELEEDVPAVVIAEARELEEPDELLNATVDEVGAIDEKEEVKVPEIIVEQSAVEEGLEGHMLHAAIAMQDSPFPDVVPDGNIGLDMPGNPDPVLPHLQENNMAPILGPVVPQVARQRDRMGLLIAASLALAAKHKYPLGVTLAGTTAAAMGMAYAWAHEANPPASKTPAKAVIPEPTVSDHTYDPTHVDDGNDMFSYRPIAVEAPKPKVSKYIPKHKRAINAMDRMVAGMSGVQPWMKAGKYRIPLQKVMKRPAANFKLLAAQKKKKKKQ